MQDGRRLQPADSLDAIRARVKRELERLPEPLRKLETGTTYPVEVADELVTLAAEVDRRLQQDSRMQQDSRIQQDLPPRS
jgi:nicotinate phosphoribosyltransferase